MINKNQSSSEVSRSRSRTEIVIQILEAVNDNDDGEDGIGVTRTTLMYEVYLSSAQLRGYLVALTIHDLLSYDSAMLTYNITKKGLRFLKLWYNLNEIAEELRARYYHHLQHHHHHDRQQRHNRNCDKLG
jgi:predicted transcriptional regulator